MEPRALFLPARTRWSIVVGATMAAMAIAGAAGTLWLGRPEIRCDSTWERPVQDVHYRNCVRRPRVGEGSHERFREVHGEPPGHSAWFVEHDVDAQVQGTRDLVIVEETTGGGDEQVVDFFAYRLIDGEPLWQISLPWTPNYTEAPAWCRMAADYYYYPRQLVGGVEDLVFFLRVDGADRSVLALDAASGATRWQTALPGWGRVPEVSIQGEELLSFDAGDTEISRIDLEGNIRSYLRPMPGAVSCLEDVGHTHPLDPDLASWLEADEASISCLAAGPRTLAVASTPSRIRVLVLAPDGTVRWKEERRNVTARLPFDAMCQRWRDPRDNLRTAAWLEQPSGAATWDLLLLDTRTLSELRFTLPEFRLARAELVSWQHATVISGDSDEIGSVEFLVPFGAPRIEANLLTAPFHFVPRSPQAEAILRPDQRLVER